MPKQKLTTRQKESRKINRKRKLRKWWQVTSRRFLLMSLATIILFLALGGWWFSYSGRLAQMTAGIEARLWQQTAKMGFRVEDLYLEGRKLTPLADITHAMDVRIGDPILAISLSDMRTKLEAIPRIRSAEVARVLPNQIHVHITEREPVAVWQNQGQLRLIDQDGVAMEPVNPKDYPHLILVVGEDAPTHTQALLLMFAQEPELYANITCAIRVGERRWNIRFKNGIELKLPEEKTAEAWQNFVRLEHEHHLLARSITSVDMRLSDRVFIQTAPIVSAPVVSAEKNG